MGSKIKEIFFDWIKIIVAAIVLSLFVRNYVAEAKWIPSESMLPTLKVGDHIIIDKLFYKLNGAGGINRGDIVVFNPPQSANLSEKVLIKRVVGLPGETISVKSGSVYINGKQINEPYILEKSSMDFAPLEIPDNEIFVMGDNRNISYDSRFWGPLPLANIIGKAEFRYYPINEMGIINP
ncbi:signal peptidase I [Pelotomaculum terephthalicicum JT]|uniref:signal peptidase I n=1 Tax=Pelotomaculum TaxID=191373 RepID=UPI0009CA9345|nr:MULTISPECIES: signal peptidase I [Pelotomaculum]MCG9968477.1 signal peptidase I [Pelotomaculum terephthalicicum JT]OPX88901.1 MAG: Signal peptidase I S [Pelotomaculum sp. PtaB.Bin117]OPY60269.1 MAG: Signal peptidase I S [Pelotomaculum sp. PtaU1.Bin065]